MKKIIVVFVAATCFVLSFSCKEHTPVDEKVPSVDSTSTQAMVNQWVYETMKTYYYWNKELPEKTNFAGDPNVFFKSLLYQPKTDDRFSWIMDNSQNNTDMLNGVGESLGCEFVLLYIDTTRTKVGGVIEYTLPNSPVSNTPIVRGDFFYKIDGQALTVANYSSLLNKKTATYTFQNKSGESYDVQLTKEVVKEDPVYLKKVLQVGNAKVGYLVYNQFTADNGDGSKLYESELKQAFAYFKEQNVTELVLDLRYNSGGLLTLSTLISSSIVPNIQPNKVSLNLKYNDILMAQLPQTEKVVYFDNNPEQYIGNKLSRLFVLTGNYTASASEAVINCLKPYMPVITIGETTYGKTVGSITLSDDQKRFDWIIQPIVMKLFNSANQSDYTLGFVPNYPVNELSIFPMPQLGDSTEPLLSTALSIISGQLKSVRSRETSSEVKVIKNSLDRKLNLPMKQMSIK